LRVGFAANHICITESTSEAPALCAASQVLLLRDSKPDRQNPSPAQKRMSRHPLPAEAFPRTSLVFSPSIPAVAPAAAPASYFQEFSLRHRLVKLNIRATFPALGLGLEAWTVSTLALVC
jgi:hypothetical protein